MKIDPAQLSIVRYPDPVLKRKAAPISAVDDDVRAVAERMIDLMHDAEGVGLAGPQVGLNWRIFVTNGREDDPEDRVFINPELSLDTGESEWGEEGCLSIPDIRVQVRRSLRASIRALDMSGNPFTLESEGWLARIWQHEFDHLNGVLIIDRMSPIDRIATRKALKEMRLDAAES